MTTSRHTLSILGAVLALSGATAPAQPADVLPPARREAAVETARRLIEAAEPAALAGEMRNPFTEYAPRRPAEAPATASRAPSRPGNRELLEKIAPLVNPSGMVRLGGEPILLFGQKRIKVGDTLPILFDGDPYILVISGIEGTSFTLRLNGEELTRPIQPAKRP